jgi:hypothetical protein
VLQKLGVLRLLASGLKQSSESDVFRLTLPQLAAVVRTLLSSVQGIMLAELVLLHQIIVGLLQFVE